MTLSAAISSSLPFISGAFQQVGSPNQAVPVVIQVSNSSSQPVRIKDIYLTNFDGAFSLGIPDIIRRGVAYAPANNVVPASGSASYDALFTPQVGALTFYPTAQYTTNIGAVVMQGNSPSVITSSTAPFLIRFNAPIRAEIISPFQVFSLADNKRPISNDGFDFQLSTNLLILTDQSFVLPITEIFYSSSDSSVAEIIENTALLNATTSSVVGGFTQLSGSGGSVIIKNTGSVEFYAWQGAISGTPLATASLQVVEALPISISITPELQNVFSGSAYPYRATLLKSNGSRQDITLQATWSVAGANATFTPSGSFQVLGVTGSFGNATISAVSGGLSATARATIINRNF